ncbi:alpha/beta fold hydrolase [Litoribacter populi]|uniref:alpha/beta fold hydrolase n=1 Tax=Litoribacter populi TaxID=2598460 RepID=UPI0011813985|nr:alpha/beta hydrolase [Litoribacter populi]
MIQSEIGFKEVGNGQPLIFIHGFCESKEMWKAFEEAFSPNYRVLCPDLPGFGESRWLEEEISLELAAVLLEDWMEELGLVKPILIGHSLGGYVTLALAELMGEKLGGLGLFHSTAFADDEEKIGMRNRTLTFVEKHGVDKFVSSFVPPLFPEHRREELKDKIDFAVELAHKTSYPGLMAFTKAMRDRKDRIDVLKNFQGPKMMIAGQADAAIKLEDSRKHEPIVDFYFELPETGHMGMFEREEKTIEVVGKFLDRYCSPSVFSTEAKRSGEI